MVRLPVRLALLALAVASGAGAETFDPVTPAAAPIAVGALKLFSLRDTTSIATNNNAVFGVGQTPEAVAALLREAGAPTDRITLSIDALLVKMPGHVVLVDAGLGPKYGGVLLQSLAKAGVSPAEVTDILVTHSHPDHVGNIAAIDGSPAFPNALIRMSAPEWAFMQAEGDKALVALIAPKIRPFQLGARVLPGIRSVALSGHTPGHSGYEISSGKARLTAIGDTAHNHIVSLGRPDWVVRYDTDSAKGMATRRAELARLAAGHQRIFSPHFPYPGVGYVVKEGAGYRWQPAP